MLEAIQKLKKSKPKLRLESGHLELRPISQKDRNDIFTEFSYEIAAFMASPLRHDFQSVDDFISHSEEEMADGQSLHFSIFDKKKQEFLGCAGISGSNSPFPKLYLWIKKSQQKNGYGTEAMKMMKLWAEQNLEYDYLIYAADKRSLPSRKISQKLGGFIGKEYEDTNFFGETIGLWEYRIYRSERSRLSTPSIYFSR